jgi:hypothetical protein
MATGDFRGTGILDLAVVNLNFHTVSVFQGNGDGTFTPNPFTYPVDSRDDEFIAVGDVNGDGHADIVVVGSNVSVLLNNGDGTFQNAIISPMHDTLASRSGFALGDVNGDGRLDIVTASDGIGVLLGNGDGTFRLPYFITSGNQGPRGLVLADLRGTGTLDLATVSFFTQCDPETGECVDYGTVSVRFGTGDGFFQPSRDYDIGGATSTIAVGDFNGDGIPDLVTGNGFSTLRPISLSVLLGNGDGTFQRPIYSSLSGAPSSLVAADFNRDGLSDVAAALPFNNAVTVALSNGDGTFGERLNLPINRYPYALVTADFNSDGFPDLASANLGTGTVSVLLNDANWPTAPGGSGRTRWAADEFRADGMPDLVGAAGLRQDGPGLTTTAVPTAGLLVCEATRRPAAAQDTDRRAGVAARVEEEFGQSPGQSGTATALADHPAYPAIPDSGGREWALLVADGFFARLDQV